MFTNLLIDHNHCLNYDVVEFDLPEDLMGKFWSFFAQQRKCVERIGQLSGVCMWDGEEDIWLMLDAIGGTITLNMETQRCCVNLNPEVNLLDSTEVIEPHDNWIRFAPILRWIKDVIAA